MLSMTEAASGAIRAMAEQHDNVTGIRITSDAEADGQLTLRTAAQPDADDQIVEDQGARVFLDSQAAFLLDSSVLDARLRDGRFRFVVTQRA